MAEEKSSSDESPKPDLMMIGVIAAVVLGISGANYLVFDALSGRLDVLESNVMSQCNTNAAAAAPVTKAAPKPAPKPAPKATAEPGPSATAEAAP